MIQIQCAEVGDIKNYYGNQTALRVYAYIKNKNKKTLRGYVNLKLRGVI